MTDQFFGEEFKQNWLPLIYLYGVGGIIFIIGMYIVLKGKALDISKKSGKRWLKILVGGFIYFIFIHLFLTIAALS